MPTDLPVEQPIGFKLAINLIPANELARADEVIEQRCRLLAKAIILESFCHGVLLVFGAPHKHRLLVGREHGRTIPLTDVLISCSKAGKTRIFMPVWEASVGESRLTPD
jgi:hypothetical protein